LERGRNGVLRVTSIVDGLLRFARAGARPEPGVTAVVPQVVQSVVSDLEPLANEARISLSVPPPPSCIIAAHAGVLASVRENLLRNAIKYMGQRPVRRIELRVLPHDGWIRFEVVDTGPGIAPAQLPTLFDPHVRGRTHGQPGLGLGLATVKRI